MALTSCPECGHKVSDKADACPSCGRKLSNARKSMGAVAAVVAVLLLTGVLGRGWRPEHSPRDAAPDVGRPNTITISNGKVVEYDEHGHKVFEGIKEEAERKLNRPGRTVRFR